jgi:hypothetical protein
LRTLIHAIETRKPQDIWSMGSDESQKSFPMDQFLENYNEGVVARTTDISIAYFAIYYPQASASQPSADQGEAYGIAILRYKIDGGDRYSQIIMQHVRGNDSWKFLGIPFWFVDAPLILIIPNIPRTPQTTRIIRTWRGSEDQVDQAEPVWEAE